MKNRCLAIRTHVLFSPMRVLRGLALFVFLFVAFSADAQTRQPSPAGAKQAPTASATHGFQVVAVSLPDEQWGYLIRGKEGVIMMSHDRSKAGWQDVPTYATEAEAIAAGNAQAQEMSAGKPKSNPQPTPTKK